jgi:hypothetical protein
MLIGVLAMSISHFLVCVGIAPQFRSLAANHRVA